MTFIKHNGFCLFSKKTSPGQYQTTRNENQSKPIFQVLKVDLLLIKVLICGYHFFYVLLSYISFYIRGYPFLKIFKTSFNLIWKNIFIANFPFYFIDSPKYQHPFMLKSASALKFFCWCSTIQFFDQAKNKIYILYFYHRLYSYS